MTVKTIIFTKDLQEIVKELKSSGAENDAITHLLSQQRDAIARTNNTDELVESLVQFGKDIYDMEARTEELAKRFSAIYVTAYTADMFYNFNTLQKTRQLVTDAYAQQTALEERQFSSYFRGNKTPKEKILAAFNTVISDHLSQQGAALPVKLGQNR